MKRLLAGIVVAVLTCGLWSSYSQAAATGCYARLYNRNGSYAVCTSSGGYYRATALDNRGVRVYGPWMWANGGNNHSDAWVSPYSVVSYGVQHY